MNTRIDSRASLALFAILLGLYLINGDFLRGEVATFSTYLPTTLLNRGKLSTTPTEMPWLFLWELRTPNGTGTIRVRRWTDHVGETSLAQFRDRGDLVLQSYLEPASPTLRRDRRTGEDVFINTFGIGAGLTALPAFAVLQILFGDLENHPRVLWHGAKVVASMLVAGSAVFVFLAARRFTGCRPSLFIALAYGLGTCVWSISSQALWQHGPDEFFLAAGACFLVYADRGRLNAALCGLTFAAAVACRPPSAIVVVAVGAYLLVANRSALLPFVLAGLPIAVALGSYNAYYQGSPFASGRDFIDREVALSKTGSEDLWQTPLATGAAGLLLSPSRGLLVHSPFMIFAVAGIVKTWRDRRFVALRPLSIATLGLVLVACKWFDWWGGWSFGYRPIVDTMPFLALFFVPVIDRLLAHWLAVFSFCFLLSWSVAVQVVGAFAYDIDSWNNQVVGYSGVRPVTADIDLPQNRQRLWSIKDSQILYLIEHFQTSRLRKKANQVDWLRLH